MSMRSRKLLFKGQGKFTVNQAGDVEYRLDSDHVLLIHAADEGVVLDVWKNGVDEAVWSTYHFFSEMIDE